MCSDDWNLPYDLRLRSSCLHLLHGLVNIKDLYPFDNVVIWFHQQDLSTEYSNMVLINAPHVVTSCQLAELYICICSSEDQKLPFTDI